MFSKMFSRFFPVQIQFPDEWNNCVLRKPVLCSDTRVGKILRIHFQKYLLLHFKQGSNQVTLKLDVSYVDHSDLIELHGDRIKSFMEQTSCVVQFPEQKENQLCNLVTVIGEVTGVEKMRCHIRVCKTNYITKCELNSSNYFRN